MPRFLCLVLLAVVSFVRPVLAQDDVEPKKAAVAAMQSWLSGIDAGKYAESWNQAASSFQMVVSQEDWVNALKTVRDPLGTCRSRKLASTLHQTSIPSPRGGAPLKGDYVIAQFKSSFANLADAIETVTFELQDGAWKASGYYIKPG